MKTQIQVLNKSSSQKNLDDLNKNSSLYYHNGNVFLLMGYAGSGKTTLYNAILDKHEPENIQDRCCSTNQIVVGSSQDKNITLVDTPDFSCQKNCFQKAIEKKKDIDLIKFKGVIAVIKFHNRIQNILETFRNLFMLNDLIKPQIQDNALVIITHMDKSNDKQKYETETIQYFKKNGFSNMKIFCSLKYPTLQEKLQLKNKILEHFSLKKSKCLNLHEYKPDKQVIQKKVESMRDKVKKDSQKQQKYRQQQRNKYYNQNNNTSSYYQNQNIYKSQNLKKQYQYGYGMGYNAGIDHAMQIQQSLSQEQKRNNNSFYKSNSSDQLYNDHKRLKQKYIDLQKILDSKDDYYGNIIKNQANEIQKLKQMQSQKIDQQKQNQSPKDTKFNEFTKQLENSIEQIQFQLKKKKSQYTGYSGYLQTLYDWVLKKLNLNQKDNLLELNSRDVFQLTRDFIVKSYIIKSRQKGNYKYDIQQFLKRLIYNQKFKGQNK